MSDTQIDVLLGAAEPFRMVQATDGTSLALHDLGGTGRPALFVHAAGLHAQVWRPVANLLADRVSSWGVDLRGHGDSGPCQIPVNWADFGCDVVAAAQAAGRPLIGVGHSLGGASMLMAELAVPGTFSELILFEPAVSEPAQVDPAIQSLYAGVAARRRSLFSSFAEALAQFAAKPPFSSLAPEVLAHYVAHGFQRDVLGEQITLKCEPQTEAAIYGDESGPGIIWSVLDAVTCPVTLLRGRQSDVWSHAVADSVAARIGARLVEVPGAGHFGPLQDPVAFAGLLRSCGI